jgi:hypothetical protein
MNRFQLLVMSSLAACGGTTGNDGSDVDTSHNDPRCVAACPETMPKSADIGAVCDSASRSQCLDECEARIAGVPTLCQSCLLESSCFNPNGCNGVETGVSCDESSCTLTSEFGTCTYAPTDMAAELACRQKVDPRREVSCTVKFQSTTKCAAVCP